MLLWHTLLMLVQCTFHNVARTLAVPPFYWRPCNCCVTAVAGVPAVTGIPAIASVIAVAGITAVAGVRLCP